MISGLNGGNTCQPPTGHPEPDWTGVGWSGEVSTEVRGPFAYVCERCGESFVRPRRPQRFNPHRFCSLACKHGSLQERFWPKVNKNGSVPAHCPELGPCWEWTAGRTRDGYGDFRHGNTKRGAHRVSYEMHNGPIPAGGLVCHACDNPPCVNPDHLFVGTDADNTRDAARKGRHKNPHTPGELHANAKLTDRDVQLIRLLCGRIGLKRSEVAERYGLSHTVISKVVNRRSWTHVPDITL